MHVLFYGHILPAFLGTFPEWNVLDKEGQSVTRNVPGVVFL